MRTLTRGRPESVRNNGSLILSRSGVTSSYFRGEEGEEGEEGGEGEEGVRASDLGPSENQATITGDDCNCKLISS